MSSLCTSGGRRENGGCGSGGRQTTLSFPLSLWVELLQLAHAHSLCLTLGARARRALEEPACGGIHYVCLLAWVKGFGKEP